VRFEPRPGVDPQALINRLRRQRTTKHFPNTARAVERLTKEGQRLFLRAIQGKPVSWSGGTFTIYRVSGRFHGQILGGYRYPYNGNPLRGAIVINQPFPWNSIRTGVRVHDMKPNILRSARAKIGADGRRYVIVPITIPNAGDPNPRLAVRAWRICKEGSRGWIYGGSAHRIHPYRGLSPRRVDLYVAETLRRRAQQQIRAALTRDLRIQGAT
jgi:hypothetical protein